MTTPTDTDTTDDTDAPAQTDDSDGTSPPASDQPGEASGWSDRPTWRRRLFWLPLVLLVVAGLIAAGAGLRGWVDGPPSDTSVDAGFARDMSTHHAQAVAMAMTEYDRGEDPAVRSVARDIALSQQREIGVMSAWLQTWGLSRASTQPVMAWMRTLPGDMGHGHSGDAAEGTDGAGTADGAVAMPGFATSAELTELASASGRDADVLFLQLMIRHHRGGVTMAQEAVLTASEPDVRTFARAVVVTQSAEIEVMQDDLARLGAPPA